MHYQHEIRKLNYQQNYPCFFCHLSVTFLLHFFITVMPCDCTVKWLKFFSMPHFEEETLQLRACTSAEYSFLLPVTITIIVILSPALTLNCQSFLKTCIPQGQKIATVNRKTRLGIILLGQLKKSKGCFHWALWRKKQHYDAVARTDRGHD